MWLLGIFVNYTCKYAGAKTNWQYKTSEATLINKETKMAVLYFLHFITFHELL